jgi:hypothetical protein
MSPNRFKESEDLIGATSDHVATDWVLIFSNITFDE